MKAQRHPKLAPDILVAVTGWGQEQDRVHAVAAGFDQHLVKPISAETLESLLQSFVHGTAAPQPPAGGL